MTQPKFFAALVLTGISLAVAGCQQAPAPVSAAPAPAAPPQVVIEEKRPQVVEEVQPRREDDHARIGVDVDLSKRQNGDHVNVDLHAHP